MLCMCVALTGCDNAEENNKNEEVAENSVNKEANNAAEKTENNNTKSSTNNTSSKSANAVGNTTGKNTNTEKNTNKNTTNKATNSTNKNTTNNTSNTSKNNDAKKDEVTIDMPKNVRIYAFQDYGPTNNNQGVYFDVIKIGNNALRTQVSTLGKNRVVQNNKGYHYFKYKGDNKWDIYYKTDSKDWYVHTPNATLEQFNTFMNIGYLSKIDAEINGKEHETIHVDGIGDVDTVHIVEQDGSPDRLVDKWYSSKLKRNIKIYTQYNQSGMEILTYDTSVTSFGISVP